MTKQVDDPKRKTIIHLYEFLVDQLNDGIHVVDSSGKTIIYNEKMSEIEAMARNDVLNKDVLDVFTFPDEGYSTLIHALQTGKPTINVKQTYFNMKGEKITTINNTMPIAFDGEIYGAVEIARDITKIERIQNNLLHRNETRYTFDSIIGNSMAIAEIISDAKRSARTNSSILIVGETGTGKELFAQSIHHASPRSAGPFISQNCAALPETLIEGILFGTTEGAFLGAVNRPGLLEQADDGTILLDELNSLSLPLQAKLLRAIQEKTIRRLGDTIDRNIDVRICATINEDPLDAITRGTLRKDLYYRLSVVTLFLPPLRERQADLLALTDYFIQKYNQLFSMHVRGVSEEVMQYFYSYSWPGNVRELEHTIEGAMNLATDYAEIDVIHLPLHIRRKVSAMHEILDNSFPGNSGEPFLPQERSLQNHLADYERAFVQKVLSKHNGNISAAARELCVSRQSLQYRLRKWNES